MRACAVSHGRGLMDHCHTSLSRAFLESPICVPQCGLPSGGGSVSLPRKRTFSPRLKRNESSLLRPELLHLDSLQKKLKDLEEENVRISIRGEVQSPPCPLSARVVAQRCLSGEYSRDYSPAVLKGGGSRKGPPWLLGHGHTSAPAGMPHL